jgi:hypothetical protein
MLPFLPKKIHPALRPFKPGLVDPQFSTLPRLVSKLIKQIVNSISVGRPIALPCETAHPLQLLADSKTI